MCAIVGVMTFKTCHTKITEASVARMRDTMAHRGPDGKGAWVSSDKTVGLGHRRLSIIDVSESASQPMLNETQSVVLSFNGEIYNFAEIRQEIESLRLFKWQTDHSDTEVILRGYEVWGIELVKKLRGEFAFAIWDGRLEQLFLVRDRIGVKPLYFSKNHQRLVFGSEIKALLADSDQARDVDLKAFYNYLSFLTTPSPDTLFKGIHKLKPGTYLKITKNGDIEETRYWDVWDHVQNLDSQSENDITHELLERLTDAVRIRKISDVPTGVFLSGGIDSSTNAMLFSNRGSQTINTFSIGYDGSYRSYKNELPFAQLMASTIRSNHHEFRISESDLFSFLPQMIFLQDEPLADPVCLPVYYLAKFAREHGVAVCQVGEGADELFWGYSSWKTSLRLQELNDRRVPKVFKRTVLMMIEMAGKDRSLPYELLRRGVNDLPVFWGGAEGFYESQKRRLVSPTVRREIGDYSSWEVLRAYHDHFLEAASEKSHLNWMTYLDLSLRLPELLLMRVDKMCMGASLEARVPFLDHKFVEFAMSIPSRIKTMDGVSKYIVKKSVRGMIPNEIIDRPKQGFGVPMYEWFFGKLGARTKDVLRDFTKQTDFFDGKEIEAEIKRNNSRNLWYLLNFALWWKYYIGREDISDAFSA